MDLCVQTVCHSRTMSQTMVSVSIVMLLYVPAALISSLYKLSEFVFFFLNERSYFELLQMAFNSLTDASSLI